jgi:hypothetical protein
MLCEAFHFPVRAHDSRDVIVRPLRTEQNFAPSERPQVCLNALCDVVLLESANALIGLLVKGIDGLNTL